MDNTQVRVIFPYEEVDLADLDLATTPLSIMSTIMTDVKAEAERVVKKGFPFLIVDKSIVPSSPEKQESWVPALDFTNPDGYGTREY